MITQHCFLPDPPKNTSLSVSPSSSVAEGSSVTLTCSSNANPAVKNYTWYRVEGREKDIVGSEEDLNISSVTRLSNEKYYCEAQNVHGLQTSEAISIDVTFASEILNTSHCIRISATSQIRCFCDSYGNPAPTLVWQLAGESVNHSTNTIISEEPMGRAGLSSSLTIHQSQKIQSLVCLSSNFIAFDSFSFDLTSMKTLEGRFRRHLSCSTPELVPNSPPVPLTIQELGTIRFYLYFCQNVIIDIALLCSMFSTYVV
ncbi:unnamed protein product [Oncorhynchus mykiss]|uniref:Ig-like domain-containing protein n=1 Tax=Oncorhynchus mykiss TaxID=8022 RepID=A0A060W171_ONCMY|nr:unnamed protein product [Oncorhynchus mykiss]